MTSAALGLILVLVVTAGALTRTHVHIEQMGRYTMRGKGFALLDAELFLMATLLPPGR